MQAEYQQRPSCVWEALRWAALLNVDAVGNALCSQGPLSISADMKCYRLGCPGRTHGLPTFLSKLLLKHTADAEIVVRGCWASTHALHTETLFSEAIHTHRSRRTTTIQTWSFPVGDQLPESSAAINMTTYFSRLFKTVVASQRAESHAKTLHHCFCMSHCTKQTHSPGIFYSLKWH